MKLSSKRIFKIFTVIIFFSINSFASTYYWVGNGGNWSTSNVHWATTSGGMVFYNQPPTGNDDVIFDQNSFTLPNQMVTLDSGFIYCHNMNWTGVLNNPTFGDNNSISNMQFTILHILGSMKLNPSMNWGFLGKLFFESPSIGNTINTFDISGLNELHFNSPTGIWQLTNNFTCAALILERGTLKTMNYSASIGLINAFGSNPFTLLCGTSHFISGMIDIESPALTIDGDSATFELFSFISLPAQHYHKIIINGQSQRIVLGNNCIVDSLDVLASTGIFTLASSNANFKTLTCYSAASFDNNNQFGNATFFDNISLNADNTFDTITFNNGGYSCYLKENSTTTINNELFANGGCDGFIGIQSMLAGTQANIFKATGTVSSSKLSLHDINAIGGATFIASNSVDGGNNTGWTILSPISRTLYWVGATGNWTDNAHWSLTSGGTGGECMPGQTDDIIFDSQSFLNPTDSIIMNSVQLNCRNMNWSGVTLPITIFNWQQPSHNWNIYGSMVLSNTLNWEYGGTITLLSGLGNTPVTTTGLSMIALMFNGTGGWNLTDSLHCANIYLNGGTLSTLNNPLHFTNFTSTGNNLRKLFLGTTTINCQNISTSGNNLTIYADSATIYAESLDFEAPASIGNAILRFSSEFQTYWNTCRLQGTGTTYRNLTATSSLSSYGFSITINHALFTQETNLNGGTFYFSYAEFRKNLISDVDIVTDTMNLNNQNYSATLNASTNLYAQNLFTQSSCSGYISIQSNYPTSPSFISVPSGVVDCSYIIVNGITAIGGATFNASNSLFISNVNGWNLLSTPVAETYFWVGGSGKWSETQHWSLTSGGSPAGCLPTFLDNVNFDNNSFITNNDTVDIDMTDAYCKNMIWQQINGNPVVYNNAPNSNYNSLNIYGNFVLDTGIIWSYPGKLNFASGGNSKIITTSNVHLNEIYFECDSASWILTDSLSCIYFTLDHGFVNTAGKNISCYRFLINDSIQLDTSVVTSLYFINHVSDSQYDGDSASIFCDYFEGYGQHYNFVKIASNSGYPYFEGVGCTIQKLKTYNNLDFYNCSNNTFGNAIFYGSTSVRGGTNFGRAEFRGSITLAGKNTFDTLFLNNSGNTVLLDRDSLQTVKHSFVVSINPFSPITIQSLSSSGDQADILCNADSVCMEYMNFRDLNVTGTTNFYGGVYSTDLGNNTGINFTACQLPVSNVWPGDANNDLVVDNNDILNIGLAYNEIGYARTGATLNWQAESCQDWNRIFGNFVNINHADCDGNGMIDSTDLAAVYANYGQTHPPVANPNGSSTGHPRSGADLFLDPTTTNYSPGDFVTIPVKLGTSSVPANSIYGVAYKINYDNSKIVNGSVNMTYPSTWFTPNGNRLSFQMDNFPAARIDDSQTRTDLTNISGNGSIAYLHFQITPTAAGTIILDITGINAVDNLGNPVTLMPIGTTLTILPLAIQQNSIAADVQVFPNPTNGNSTLTYSIQQKGNVKFEIYDVSGKVIYSENKSQQTAGEYSITLPMEKLSNGIYFCRFTAGEISRTLKIVKTE